MTLHACLRIATLSSKALVQTRLLRLFLACRKANSYKHIDPSADRLCFPDPCTPFAAFASGVSFLAEATSPAQLSDESSVKAGFCCTPVLLPGPS